MDKRKITLRWAGILMLMCASGVAHGETIWPGSEWARAEPSDVGMDPQQLDKARKYALTGGGAGVIVRSGKLVMAWGDTSQRFDLKSTTKSIGGTALGLAIGDEKVRLTDRAADHHPSFGTPPASNAKSPWLKLITLEHLSRQTAGFDKPGGYTALQFKAGTKWAYSDGGPNWLAECLTLTYRRDLQDLMFQRVFTPLGIDSKDLRWRKNAYRPATIDGIGRREFGSGINANVDAMARIGYLYLRRGKWRQQQIIPASFVEMASRPHPMLKDLPVVKPASYGKASSHYGLLWWNNGDGRLAGVPRDAYWSWGLYDSLIVVVPSLDLVAARAGKSWQRKWDGHYDVLAPFLSPLAKSVVAKSSPQQPPGNRPARKPPNKNKQKKTPQTTRDVSGENEAKPPYPASPRIAGISWSPASTIVRRARGSDNWPITWGDDDALYTAYGDGRGFRPLVEKKLSLGICRVLGAAADPRGTNIRSASIERTGDGRRGPKASGMLMVDGTLYMLIRNTGNSQLAWSKDRGATWIWSDWKFTTSFGYPTFLNFGKNYANARDRYVYIYSHDQASAYEPADSMVLARVPADQITQRRDYQFFAGFSATKSGEPRWSADITKRAAVFEHAGHCYRSSVSYHPHLKRYLWCQTGFGKDSRFRGGLAIYDAEQPWGPWTTVYFTSNWDVGPGETASFPTKWMESDGRTIHLLFSGDDAFSVRRATLRAP